MNPGFETLRWSGDYDGLLELIDQRLLPGRLEYLKCQDPQTLFDAIRDPGRTRRPGYRRGGGLWRLPWIAGSARPGSHPAGQSEQARKTADYLATSRPTAVNLFWALERMKKTAADFTSANPAATAQSLKTDTSGRSPNHRKRRTNRCVLPSGKTACRLSPMAARY